MIIKDHFLSKEDFELQETSIQGIYKTHPIPEKLDRYYESTDYISHYQDEKGLKHKLYKFLQGFNLNFKRNILANELHKNANVLDYGFGAGEFLKYIEDDFTTFGFEPNKSAGEFAAKKLSKTQIIDDLNTIENES
ncbi:MAG: methyltransferase type 11, partial [Kaistella sp.]|nr:methyltransferase type 11 [Kaistella sp.]